MQKTRCVIKSSMLVADVAMLDCGKSLIFSAVACLHSPQSPPLTVPWPGPSGQKIKSVELRSAPIKLSRGGHAA